MSGGRVRVIAMVLFLVCALTGCEYSARRAGAEHKLAELLRRFGACVVMSNDIPALGGSCVVWWDDHGFEARVYRATYSQVEEWFVQMVGPPSERFKTVKCKLGCVFRATDIGV